MTHCLTHQMEEDQATPFGPMCPCCKLRLYAIPPSGRVRGFWESQPGAYTLKRQPMFVFSLMWDDFRIRALHPADSYDDRRGAIAREYELAKAERAAREAAALAKKIVPLVDTAPGSQRPLTEEEVEALLRTLDSEPDDSPRDNGHDDDLLTPEEIEALLGAAGASDDKPRGDDRVPNEFRRGGFESMNFESSNEIGSIEISSESEGGPFADEDDDDEPDEKWLDLPDPESWLDLDWQSDSSDEPPKA